MKEKQAMNIDSYLKMLEEWFARLPLPPLPVNAKEGLVKIAPWLALIFGILGVLVSLSATGLLTVFSPFMVLGGGLGMAAGGLAGAVLGIVSSALMLMAYPGLKDRKMTGWKWSVYSQTVSVIASIVALNLVGALIGGLIGFYILFQIKSYYK